MLPLALALLLLPCFGHCNGQCKCLAHSDSSIHSPQWSLNIQKSAITKGNYIDYLKRVKPIVFFWKCFQVEKLLNESQSVGMMRKEVKRHGETTKLSFLHYLYIFSELCSSRLLTSVHTTIYNCSEKKRQMEASIRCYQQQQLHITSWAS